MSTKPLALKEVDYPESDGKPMGETDVHRNWMVRLIEMLAYLFGGQRVYVSGDLLVYYVEGDPRRFIVPDVFVVKNCAPGERRIFQIWKERKSPQFIMEVTSKKTRQVDRGPKKELYAQLQVAEYFLYDPLGEWLKPALQGYRLVDGQYVPIPPDAEGGIPSQQLGITFKLEDGQLVLIHTATRKRLLTDAERADEAEARAVAAEASAAAAGASAAAAEARAVQESAARRALEEELARLRAEQGRRKKRRKGQ